MLRTRYKYFFISVLVGMVACCFTACEQPSALIGDDRFDTKAMLSNLGSSIIIPKYVAFSQDVKDMRAAYQGFKTQTSSLLEVQLAFKKAYTSWAEVSLFEFGPAESQNLRVSANAFPADTIQILSNIQVGNYDLKAANNIDAKGFPALDYLLFSASVNLADSSTEAYINALLSDLEALSNTMVLEWDNQSYLSTFVENNTVDLGGSIGQLVNQLNFDLEITKNFRLGIPMGKRSTNGNVLLDQIEARQSKLSLSLIIKSIQSSKNVFNGIGNNPANNIGLDDYLRALRNEGEEDVAFKINAQYDKVLGLFNSLNQDFEQAVTNRDVVLGNAYNELQFLVQLTKTSMASKLGVMIAYQDGDGD